MFCVRISCFDPEYAIRVEATFTKRIRAVNIIYTNTLYKMRRVR